MPIYEYKCISCETSFEKLQKTSDKPLTACEDCQGELKKQWSLSGFQFKGDGWYVTDYARKNGDKAEKAEKTKNTEKKVSSESTEKPKSASKEKTTDLPKKGKES